MVNVSKRNAQMTNHVNFEVGLKVNCIDRWTDHDKHQVHSNSIYSLRLRILNSHYSISVGWVRWTRRWNYWKILVAVCRKCRNFKVICINESDCDFKRWYKYDDRKEIWSRYKTVWEETAYIHVTLFKLLPQTFSHNVIKTLYQYFLFSKFHG